jgi:hypothetical protein
MDSLDHILAPQSSKPAAKSPTLGDKLRTSKALLPTLAVWVSPHSPWLPLWSVTASWLKTAFPRLLQQPWPHP